MGKFIKLSIIIQGSTEKILYAKAITLSETSNHAVQKTLEKSFCFPGVKFVTKLYSGIGLTS